MPQPSNTDQSITAISHSKLSEIVHSIDSLNDAIRYDLQVFAGIASPLELMQIRAENAEAALRISDIALEALKVLQANSFDIIKASDLAMAAMKANHQSQRRRCSP